MNPPRFLEGRQEQRILARGDRERARHLVALGLAWQPDGTELGYLTRILERADSAPGSGPAR